MPDDPIRQAILTLLARRGEFVLAGNKEHYAYLRHDGACWVRIEGDPMTQGADETETPVTDSEVLSAVRWRVRERMELYGRDDGRPDWAGVLAWLNAGWR